MAIPVVTIILATKAVNAMSETRSILSPIQAAAKAQATWFYVYVSVQVLAVGLAVVAWLATNRYQALVKGDADARIAEAGSKAAGANQGAAEANERAKDLEHANLSLRKDLNEAAAKVAGIQKDAADAQKDAADAKAAQQRVEVEWAKQKERAAIAERELLELQERIKPRTISMAQRTRLMDILRQAPKGPVSVTCVLGDGEGFALAREIEQVLTASGWRVEGGVTQGVFGPRNPIGTALAIHDPKTPPTHAAPLQHTFTSVGIPLLASASAEVPEGTVRIMVGNKP